MSDTSERACITCKYITATKRNTPSFWKCGRTMEYCTLERSYGECKDGKMWTPVPPEPPMPPHEPGVFERFWIYLFGRN